MNFNGSLFKDNEKVLDAGNRAFRYGDGLFESMRAINGKVPLFHLHFDRLLRGMKALKFTIPSYFNIHYLRNEVSKVLEDNPHSRVRLAVWRENGGLYTPITHNSDFLIEASTLPDKHFMFNDLGYTIGVFKECFTHYSPISRFKTSNALPYVLAGIYAKENGFEDVLMFNTEGYITEGIASNVFLYQSGVLYTPPISSGCVEGIMRSVIIEIAQKLNIPLSETPLNLETIRGAQEIFFTNAVQGIRWVERFEDKEYGYSFSAQLHERLIKDYV